MGGNKFVQRQATVYKLVYYWRRKDAVILSPDDPFLIYVALDGQPPYDPIEAVKAVEDPEDHVLEWARVPICEGA